MRIVYFTDLFLPDGGGVTTSLLNLTDELSKKHQILIVAPKPKKGKKINFKNKKIELFLTSSAPGLVYPNFRLATPNLIKLNQKIKGFKPDIIHSHTQITLGINGIIIAKIQEIPIVATLHSPLTEKEVLKTLKLKPTKTTQKILKKYNNFYHDRCDLVFAPSSYLAKRLVQEGLKSKVVVLSNCIPSSLSTNLKKPNLKKTYPLKDFNLLFVGRLSAEKEVSTLINSITYLKNKIPGLSLLIIGTGPEQKELKNQVKKLNFNKYIHFVGHLEYSKLLKSGLYQACDLFVSASRCEVQPVSFLEALSFNLPIIASDASGLDELVRGNGLLVKGDKPKDFADAIYKYYKDSALQQKITKNIQKTAPKYKSEAVAKTALKYYQEVIKKYKPNLSNVFKILKLSFFKNN